MSGRNPRTTGLSRPRRAAAYTLVRSWRALAGGSEGEVASVAERGASERGGSPASSQPTTIAAAIARRQADRSARVRLGGAESMKAGRVEPRHAAGLFAFFACALRV